MKKRIVISNTRTKLPIQSTVLYVFLLYHFNVSGVYWGIFITLYSIYWIIAIVIVWNETSIDIFSDKDSEEKQQLRQTLSEVIERRKRQ